VGGEPASGVLTVLEDHGVTWALSLRGGAYPQTNPIIIITNRLSLD
jgi:hypothetical protein